MQEDTVIFETETFKRILGQIVKSREQRYYSIIVNSDVFGLPLQ